MKLAEEILALLERILSMAAETTIMVFEYIGVAVMIVAAGKAVWDGFHRNPYLRIRLGTEMATALQFLMGGEILRTVVTHDLKGVLEIGALVIIRMALAFLLHWETRHEEQKWSDAYEKHEEREERKKEKERQKQEKEHAHLP